MSKVSTWFLKTPTSKKVTPIPWLVTIMHFLMSKPRRRVDGSSSRESSEQFNESVAFHVWWHVKVEEKKMRPEMGHVADQPVLQLGWFRWAVANAADVPQRMSAAKPPKTPSFSQHVTWFVNHLHSCQLPVKLLSIRSLQHRAKRIQWKRKI